MIGCQDFCGHYDWTFEYLRREYGEAAVRAYWEQAIAFDSQQHARALIRTKGFQGMAEYWGHTLTEEEAGYAMELGERFFRIEMRRCPSKLFLTEHGLGAYHDYCEHCIGWIRPLMDESGYVVDHAHNHQGQCWWEFRRAEDREATPAADGIGLHPEWESGEIHAYRGSIRQP